MFNSEITALLRLVLDEVCERLSQNEAGARARVASRLQEAVAKGETSAEVLRQLGHEALTQAPTMWR